MHNVVTCASLGVQEKELAKEMGGLGLGDGEGQSSSVAAGGAKKYSKSSFFDNISCDVLDRAQGG